MTQESHVKPLYLSIFGARRWWILIVFIVAVVIGGGIWFAQRGEEDVIETEEALPLVEVKSFGELKQGAKIEQVATLEPAEGASLIARTGGRVTAVKAQLGDNVSAGQVILGIDGGVEASPARAQLNTAAASLSVFDDIQQTALGAGDLAVETAQVSVEAAEAGRKITSEQLAKAREQADLAVRQAELIFEDAKESENREQIIRAADLGLQAARLAQDQATIGRNLGNQQTGDALAQARLGLATAREARERTAAELKSQRVGIAGQVAAAREQVKLAQVTAPLAGQITRLTIKTGDFIQPGQEVGQIVSPGGVQVSLDVAMGVREQIAIGDEVNLKAGEQSFTGQVARLAEAPRIDVALWQVEIFVSELPDRVQPGDLVVVELAVAPSVARAGSGQDTVLVPLDIVVVREGGLVLFAINAEGEVSEHRVEVVDFTSDFVESRVDLEDDSLVIVSNNRTRQAGERVAFK